MAKGDYVLDLARMHIELGDEALTEELLTACLYAMSAENEVPPGQMLVLLSEVIPTKDDWEENYLPQLLEFPDEYTSID